MPWPLPQDYNEALQNLQTSFSDPELREGKRSSTPWVFRNPVLATSPTCTPSSALPREANGLSSASHAKSVDYASAIEKSASISSRFVFHSRSISNTSNEASAFPATGIQC